MADLKKLAEEIVNLTLLEAQELKTILKDEYDIEPAAGGAVMMAGPAGDAGGAAEEKTEFDVVLKNARPERSQRPRRSWRQNQRRCRQGRSRRHQRQAGSSWRRGRAGLSDLNLRVQMPLTIWLLKRRSFGPPFLLGGVFLRRARDQIMHLV